MIARVIVAAVLLFFVAAAAIDLTTPDTEAVSACMTYDPAYIAAIDAEPPAIDSLDDGPGRPNEAVIFARVTPLPFPACEVLE